MALNGKDTVPKWVRKYGKDDIGKVIRVEKPKEVNEVPAQSRLIT